MFPDSKSVSMDAISSFIASRFERMPFLRLSRSSESLALYAFKKSTVSIRCCFSSSIDKCAKCLSPSFLIGNPSYKVFPSLTSLKLLFCMCYNELVKSDLTIYYSNSDYGQNTTLRSHHRYCDGLWLDPSIFVRR